MNLNKVRKTTNSSLGKRILAGVLSTLMMVGTPVIPSFAETASGPFKGTALDIELPDESLKRPGINMTPTIYSGNGKYQYSYKSNGFTMVTGQAIEKNVAARPKRPVDPETDPNFGSLTPEEQAEKKELYQEALAKYPGEVADYFRDRSSWQQPGINFPSDINSYQKGTLTGFTPATPLGTGEISSTLDLFETAPQKTEIEGSGYISLKGKAKANPALDLEVILEVIDRQDAAANDPTNFTTMRDRANYIVKVTNPLPDSLKNKEQFTEADLAALNALKAEVFGLSWNVDTYIVTQDSAPFFGKGINQFSTSNTRIGFPTGLTNNLTNEKKIELFGADDGGQGKDPHKDNIPEYLYASNYVQGQNPRDLRVAIIYPQANSSKTIKNISNKGKPALTPSGKPFIGTDGDEDAKYWEVPNYFGMDEYSRLVTHSGTDPLNGTPGRNYYFWRAVGSGSSGDSGHMVRYNPKVVLPGETLYFGVTYGNATVDTKNPNGPYLLKNNPDTDVTVSNNEYGTFGLDLRYGNTGATLYDAEIVMYLPKEYIVADPSMETSDIPSEKWTKQPAPVMKMINNKNVECYVWRRKVGELNRGESSVTKPVVLRGYPQRGNRGDGQTQFPDNKGVIPAYAFELEYATAPGGALKVPAQGDQEYVYTHKDVAIRLPYLSPVNLRGTIWRDLNGDGRLVAQEGLLNVVANIANEANKPSTQKTEVGGVLKFVNGYADDTTKEYTVSFNLDPADPVRMEKYIWTFDKDYTFEKSKASLREQFADNDKPLVDSMEEDNKYYETEADNKINGLNIIKTRPGADTIFEKFESGEDAVGNVNFTFALDDTKYDGSLIDFRIKEVLAGKVNIYPYLDKNSDHQYQDSDSYIKKGTYKLIGPSANKQGEATNDGDKHKIKLPAFDDYKLTYNAPYGFRTIDGLRTADINLQNLESLFKKPNGTDVPIELTAKDIRFADSEGNPEYPDMVKDPNGTLQTNGDLVIKLETATTSTEYELKFNAWDGIDASQKPQLIAPANLDRAGKFDWELMADSGILESGHDQGKISSDGKITLKADVQGEAKVKVSWKDNPNIFDIVTIKVKKPQPPILQDNEQLLGFVVEPGDVSVAVGRKSPLLTLKARVQTPAGPVLREVHPDQLQEFTPAGQNQFEILPPQGESKQFQVKGLTSGGPYNYTVKYGDQVYTPEGTVKVTPHQYTPSSHSLELTPEIVRVKVGETLDVAYKLASLVGPEFDHLNAETLLTRSEFLHPAKAEFDGGIKTKIRGLEVGTTTLKLAVGDITKDVTVIVYDDTTPPAADGKIGFEEITDKNGLLKPNEEAKYKLFIDTNGDGIKQDTEEYVKNSDNVDLSAADTNVTVAKAPGTVPTAPVIAVVTGNTAGADALKAKVSLPSGRVYEGEKPLTVVPASTALNELTLNPEAIVIKQGSTNEQMIVSAQYQGVTPALELDRNLYELSFAPGGIASEYGNKSGKNIRIKGDNVGVTDVKATFEGKDVTGKVIVIPADTKLVIKDEPVWVKKDGTKEPQIEFVSNGQPLAPALQEALRPLVELTPANPAVAATTPEGTLSGAEVGRTTVTASLPGFPEIRDTKDVFVYTDGALKVPDTDLVTNQIKSVGLYLEKGAERIPVPAKYVRLKVEDVTVSDLDINGINTTIPATEDGRVVRGELARVKGISAAGTRETKLIATIPSEGLSAEGKITVVAGYVFSGPLTVEPSRVDLWTADDKVELVVKDKNGREVPPDLLDGIAQSDLQDPTKNTIVVEDGKVYVKKSSGDVTGTNELGISLKNDPSASIAVPVQIVNHDSNTQGQEHELVLPDFAVGVGEVRDLLFDKIKVKPKNGTVEKPLADYTTNRADVFVQFNNQPLNGKVAENQATPLAPPVVKAFEGKVPGATSYKVTVTLPGGEVLTAEGKIAVYNNLQGNKKLVVVKSVFNPATGLTELVPLKNGEKVPVNTPLSVQLHIEDPNDPTSVQIVSGAALPYFVDDLKPEAGSNFKVSEVGEIIQKSPTSGSVKVTGDLTEDDNPNIGTLDPSQPFELQRVQPIAPKPGPIKVEPNKLLIPVNGTGTITGITYADGTPVPADKISIVPANPVIANNGSVPNTIDGKTPGDTEVYVVVEGYPPVKVPVKVYDETNADIGVNPDPTDPNIGANPNDPNYPGGFPVPNEIVMVPVGGEVPFVLDINGVPVPADEFDVVVRSGGMTTHSAIHMDDNKIEGLSPGVDEAEFTLKSNPNIKKVLKIVVFDPNAAAAPSIQITEKPIVFRQNGDTDVMINAVVDLNGAPNATVMWIVEDVGVASFAGTNSLTEPSSSNPAHNVTLNWETNAPRTTKLTAIVLESGKLDTTILSGKEIEVDYIDYIGPRPLETEKDVPKTLDAMGPFDIKMFDDNGNEYPLSIADFDVVGADGPITLSGPDNRIITATGVGPKTLKLRHKTSGKEIEIPVSIPEDAMANQATITFDPNGGTLTGPATQMVEKGRPTTLPTPTRPGYTFDGWYDVNGNKYDSSTPITDNVALIAHWTQSGGTGGGGAGGGQPSTPAPTPKPTPTPTPVPTPDPGEDKGYIELNKNAKFAYITGYPDKTVKAGAPITRAEVSAIFARLMKSAILMDENYRSEFGDVRSGVWYTNYIGYLEGFNILTGYPDGSFRPNNHITRAEFAVIISKFAQLKTDTPSKFKDVNDSHWAKKYVDNAVAQGWMGGYPDGSFKPNQPITRAEVVTVVNKMIERTPKKDYLSKSDRYKDLKQDYWAYADVLEASTDHTIGKSKDVGAHDLGGNDSKATDKFAKSKKN
ncbi:MAG: S-layer homology domain-containing protein [Filifactor alocis]|nr:S-layer homology domain-containing protein [Filifactor alocis]